MKDKFRYIPQKDRKKILLLSDDLRTFSGVGSMAREIVINTVHHFNWVNLGSATKHPDEKKAFDLSADTNKEAGITDSYVKVYAWSGYGNPEILRHLINVEKPDAIMIFTDPRYWVWLFEMEREIRSKIPLYYLNIWDDSPPPLYNQDYYRSVDVLLSISKQTKNINESVLGERAKEKIIEYVPHGISGKYFYPIKKETEEFEKLEAFRTGLFGKDEEIEFIVFFNSRNIHRKHIPDTILAYRQFCDMIGKEEAKKCALILHTDPVDPNGTDLPTVKEAFCDPEYVKVFFSSKKLELAQMNLLYNLADVTILLSSNEGWGLALTESMMAGTMIIANTTGGMQDQMRFEKDGKWVDFTPDFPSNHNGTVKKHGEWAVPVYPTNLSIAGSTTTPYIYDDRCSFTDAAKAIHRVYKMGKSTRDKHGKKGSEWVRGEEAMMTAENMGVNVIKTLDRGFEQFKPRPSFDFIKIEDRPKRYIKHKIYGY